jgi:hypothetical protein
VLVPIKDGFTVRLPRLVLVHDEHGGHFISETEALDNGHKVAHPSPKLVPAMDIVRAWQVHQEYLRRSDTKPDSYQFYAEKMAKRIENESPDSPTRTAALEGFKCYANSCYAFNYVCENAPKKDESRMIKQVASATSEQLAAFREKTEGLALAGIEPQKLLESFGEPRPAAAKTDGANGSQRSHPGPATATEANGAE